MMNVQCIVLYALFSNAAAWSRVNVGRGFSTRQLASSAWCRQRHHGWSSLALGVLDSIGDFWSNRQGDFIKMEESGDAYGPGPVLIAYNVPIAIEDDELQDMLLDGAPQAASRSKTGATNTIYRINDVTNAALQLPMQDALEQMATGSLTSTLQEMQVGSSDTVTPVLLFSGFRNVELKACCDIIAGEIYAESGQKAACAKAVPAAMAKPLQQVLEEISGDHAEALAG